MTEQLQEDFFNLSEEKPSKSSKKEWMDPIQVASINERAGVCIEPQLEEGLNSRQTTQEGSGRLFGPDWEGTQ